MTSACDSEVEKTVKIPQCIVRIVDVPVVMRRHEPTIQTVQKTVEEGRGFSEPVF